MDYLDWKIEVEYTIKKIQKLENEIELEKVFLKAAEAELDKHEKPKGTTV